MGEFDLQVNGYAGVDFNDPEARPGDFERACEQLAADGVDGILATIITAVPDRMERLVAGIVAAREESPLCARVIAGIHLEGPFLNPAPGFVGAHPADHVLPADLAVMDRFLEAGQGSIRLVTLAPESDPDQALTRHLVASGVVVAAGHCDPTRAELRAAINAGLTLFTHLGNGCPTALDRHDNIIQRVLSMADRLHVSFIPDGHHVPWFALGNYLDRVGLERVLFTTDAMAGAAAGPGPHRLGNLVVEVGGDGCPRLPGTDLLAGSTATMRKIRRDCARELGLSNADLDRLCSLNPRRALGLPDPP